MENFVLNLLPQLGKVQTKSLSPPLLAVNPECFINYLFIVPNPIKYSSRLDRRKILLAQNSRVINVRQSYIINNIIFFQTYTHVPLI